jgi:dynactin complex subunit
MAVLKPRNRLVYFRVSEEEFQLFSGMCEIEGARSISDLARLALQRLAQEHRLNTEDDFIGKLKAINEVLNELGDKVERLKTQLESADGAGGKTMILTPVR